MLQGYATKRLFEKYSNNQAEVEIIDCRYGEKKISKLSLIGIRLKRLFIYLTQLNRIFKLTKYKKQSHLKHKAFDDFAHSCFSLSSKTYPKSSDLYLDPPIYDIYVTGSDQTWSPKIGLRDSLFLGFAPEGKVRAAYAPSIGVTSLNYEQCEYIGERLKKYQYVSCREKYGSNILSSLTKFDVVTVLDPTLMIDAKEWREISVKPSIQDKYILCYFIGDRKYYRTFAQNFSMQTGLPLVIIPVSYVDYSSNNNLEWKAGPREFLGLIDNAEYVLTDSFHGTLFSINFNKTFFSFVKHKGLNSMDNMRIVDILERLSLQDRLFDDYNGSIINIEHLDYSLPNVLLEKERKTSGEYINKIIYSVE